MAETPVFQPFLSAGVRLPADALHRLSSAGEVLEAKKRSGAPKVIAVNETNGCDLIIKFWYPDHWFSSATYNPYNRRFRLNADRLRARGVAAPLVRGWGTIGSDRTCFICYEALPGQSLRALKPDLNLPGAAGFVAGLHDRGIDFRSLHMGNILLAGDDRYSLIDITDCRFLRRPLSIRLRIRRLAYFFSHKLDADFLTRDDHWLEFIDGYCQAAEAADESPYPLHAHLNSIRKLMHTGTTQ